MILPHDFFTKRRQKWQKPHPFLTQPHFIVKVEGGRFTQSNCD
jgi:hypothetical protein